MMGNTDDTSESTTATPMHGTIDSAVEGDRKLSTAVVEAVAEAAGVDPMELGTALYDCIDPDALDALFAPTLDGTGRGGGTVTFEMAGYRVTVHDDSSVEVTETTR